jgi:hypothetical protein
VLVWVLKHPATFVSKENRNFKKNRQASKHTQTVKIHCVRSQTKCTGQVPHKHVAQQIATKLHLAIGRPKGGNSPVSVDKQKKSKRKARVQLLAPLTKQKDT